LDVLARYLPEFAVKPVFDLIVANNVHLKIVNDRVTRHGDYRSYMGRHEITVNASLNRYRFLMTLIHEIAHLVAFEKYGRAIKPHGQEWKYVFQQLMVPFIRPEVFPSELLPLLARHFRNPTASSDTDATLSIALKRYDLGHEEKTFVFQLPYGALFRTNGGRVFQRGAQRTKRFECVEVSSGKLYLFNPNAEVDPV
jgi:hypothetical protein